MDSNSIFSIRVLSSPSLFLVGQEFVVVKDRLVFIVVVRVGHDALLVVIHHVVGIERRSRQARTRTYGRPRGHRPPYSRAGSMGWSSLSRTTTSRPSDCNSFTSTLNDSRARPASGMLSPLDDGLVGACTRPLTSSDLTVSSLLQRIRRAVSLQRPDLHFAEALAAELRLAAKRLLRDQRVGAGRARHGSYRPPDGAA